LGFYSVSVKAGPSGQCGRGWGWDWFFMPFSILPERRGALQQEASLPLLLPAACCSPAACAAANCGGSTSALADERPTSERAPTSKPGERTRPTLQMWAVARDQCAWLRLAPRCPPADLEPALARCEHERECVARCRALTQHAAGHVAVDRCGTGANVPTHIIKPRFDLVVRAAQLHRARVQRRWVADRGILSPTPHLRQPV